MDHCVAGFVVFVYCSHGRQEGEFFNYLKTGEAVYRRRRCRGVRSWFSLRPVGSQNGRYKKHQFESNWTSAKKSLSGYKRGSPLSRSKARSLTLDLRVSKGHTTPFRTTLRQVKCKRHHGGDDGAVAQRTKQIPVVHPTQKTDASPQELIQRMADQQ